MQQPAPIDLTQFIYILLTLMGIALVLAIILLIWIFWRIKRINLPPNADFKTALRATPLVVVIMLDLLDFGLDIFAAPFSWVILSRLGLAPLRGVTMIEGLIPGTQAIPLMTVAWFAVRLMKRPPF
jgi:hypothetical protein